MFQIVHKEINLGRNSFGKVIKHGALEDTMLVPIFFNIEKYLQHSIQLIFDYEMCFDIVSFVGHNSPYISAVNIITQALPL